MNISYKSIRNSCVSVLVIILILLGLLSYTVTNRVAEYDELISDNLSQLYFIIQFESQLHKVMVDVQQVILNNLVEIDTSISNLDKLLEFSQKVQGTNHKSVQKLPSENIADLHRKLRQLKFALLNYSKEIRYDPSADTTLGLEKIVVEIQIQSDRIFEQFAAKETHEIKIVQGNLNSYVKRVHLLSIYGLVIGVSLGIIVAAILTRALSSPIKRLIRGTDELSKGNFDYKISIQSADEIGKLTEAFNQMGTAFREKEEMKAQLLLTQFSLDNASDAAFWVNKAGRIIYVNKSACHRLGYSRQDLIQCHIFDIDKNLNSVDP